MSRYSDMYEGCVKHEPYGPPIRITVSGHVARAGKTRGPLTEAQVDEAGPLL